MLVWLFLPRYFKNPLPISYVLFIFIILAFMANIAAAAYINSCDNCDIAWLYKDAQMFGFDKYKALVGGSNAICPGVGPILETDNVDFIALMNSCPCKYQLRPSKKIRKKIRIFSF